MFKQEPPKITTGGDRVLFTHLSLAECPVGLSRVCKGGGPDPRVVTSPVTLHVAGFMTYIVEPLFREWARFTGNSTLSENMLSHLAHNKAQWKSLLSKQHRRRGSGQDSAAPTSETLEQTEGATP